MQTKNMDKIIVIEDDNIFFEDINEWDNFCNELDLTELNNMVYSKKEE